jgi:hypothetical protein
MAGDKKVGKDEGSTHQTPRRMPGQHGGAVPARPARSYLGKSSPSTPGAPHLGASTGVHTHLIHPRRRTASTRRNQRGIGLGGDRSQRNPSGIQPRISSERKRPTNPAGGRGRGRWGAAFAPGGSDEGRRRRAGTPGDGGGN